MDGNNEKQKSPETAYEVQEITVFLTKKFKLIK